MLWKVVLGLLLVAAAILPLWASDRITLSGERTLYSVRCERGTWDGTRCTGRLAPAERYAFRASRTRQEVAHWVRGSSQPSGLYAHCTVKDRDNWVCEARPDERVSVTHELQRGRPQKATISDGGALHGVAKWKWMTMKMGLGAFEDADY